MTSLEAYITSLIIDQVAKYVKNIRKEDYKLSLWEGDVAFQNVELELTALQDKLHLPIEFISGHIHELSIHIPWASLNSESIVVTLNTFELIIKPSKKIYKAEPCKEARPPSDQNPGIFPKIVNNIIIDCHYIILKFIDEGISLCVTVQSLQLVPANESWNAAFVYIDPNNVLIRRLLSVNGLNICLDKTNSSGKIEVAQEPVIFNCALEIRFIKEYKLATLQTTSKTKIHIFLCSFDINVSTVQFPLAQKLVDTISSFKSKRCKEESDPTIIVATNNTQSYSAWAWSMLPSIFTKTAEPEIGHLLNIAIYIKELTITLRSSEFMKTRKNRYEPIFCLTINGLFLEIVRVDKKWFNSIGGFSSIIFVPLSEYVNQSPAYFIMSEEIITKQYVKESLFDVIPKCIGSNPRTNEKFPTNLNDYLNRITMNSLIGRAPAFCFDVVNVEEEIEEARSNVNKIAPERLTVRLSLASLPKFLKIYKTIIEFAKN